MKKGIAILLLLSTLTGVFASCQAAPSLSESKTEAETKTEEKAETKTKDDGNVKETVAKTEEKETAPAVTEETPAVTEETPAPSDHMLDGKKVIFVGNSYTYYGNAVMNKAMTLRSQTSRMNDRGYFYQICKNNGAEVNVTNWTYGSHGIGDLFQSCTIAKCEKGYKHTNDLKDAYYDYVFLQDRSGEEYTVDQVVNNVKSAVTFFRAANPDAKFFFFAQSRLYEWNVQWLPALKEIEKMGVKVIEWGALVNDVINGKTKVPGAKEQYNKNSFIINQSADDGYHPNMLTGYITAQMAYCALTGESAVGQKYSFCTDATVQSAFNPATYMSKYYTYNGATTNLLKIFQSADDMAGLQKLMDQYL